MMKRTSWLGAALALGAVSVVASGASVALASSHREAPSIAADPSADNTDLYAFVQGSNLVIVADYIGLEIPEAAPNWAAFSDDVLYEIHLTRGGTSLSDVLTYQIKFTTAKPVETENTVPLPQTPAGGLEFFAQLTGSGAFGQTYTVTQLTNGGTPTVLASGVKVPPPNVGPETDVVAYGINSPATYESTFIDSGASTGTLTGGGSIFAGPRDDPFFVDLGAIFDLAQLRAVATPATALPIRDSIAYTNVHAIVLQIPLTVANGGTAPTAGTGTLAQTVGVWASASRQKVSVLRRTGEDAHFGPFVQVSRLGLPLINEAVIGVEDKDLWNRLTPSDDATDFLTYFDNPIIVRDAEAVGLYGSALKSVTSNGGKDLESGRAVGIFGVVNQGLAGVTALGDILRVDLGTASGASAFPNGRNLTDDVVNTELALLLCSPAHLNCLAGDTGPTSNEPEAPLPKGGATPAFPYLQTPWEGYSAAPRTAPVP